jgi:hypothetical protein
LLLEESVGNQKSKISNLKKLLASLRFGVIVPGRPLEQHGNALPREMIARAESSVYRMRLISQPRNNAGDPRQDAKFGMVFRRYSFIRFFMNDCSAP